MNFEQALEKLNLQYNILSVINLNEVKELGEKWFIDTLTSIYKEEYTPTERIVFTMSRIDEYHSESEVGEILKLLHFSLRDVDITPCFVVMLTTNENIKNEIRFLNESGFETIDTIVCTTEKKLDRAVRVKKDKVRAYSNFKWNERSPVFIAEDDLTELQKHRVMHSDYFCMIPWIHLHGWPTGEAFPCCLGEGHSPIGNLKQNTIAEIWNGEDYREMRRNMLEDKPCKQCTRCYEQESHGFASMRINTNRHFAQHIADVETTEPDGTYPMKFRYWDIRFSNVCNLKCRTCGGIFSSRWYDDEVKLNGGKPMRERILFAGRHELDIWEQMEGQIQYLEQIYFAGGEPLIMEEHYRILDKLIETGNTNVRLVYNTNLTEMRHKGKYAIEYWKKFPNVCVAASLDAMGDLAELLRSGTDWNKVEKNIQDIKRECPHIDFLISPTLSVMNVWQLPEFHRYMIDKGYLRPMDLNVNILQSPDNYRIDILPQELKNEIREMYEKHIEYLDPLDSMKRAVNGFRSALQFMDATDNSKHILDFWKTATRLDEIRKEDIVSVIPQLARLKSE